MAARKFSCLKCTLGKEPDLVRIQGAPDTLIKGRALRNPVSWHGATIRFDHDAHDFRVCDAEVTEQIDPLAITQRIFADDKVDIDVVRQCACLFYRLCCKYSVSAFNTQFLNYVRPFVWVGNSK